MNRVAVRAFGWARDCRGGVALIFGLSIAVMFGAVGSAIDFSRVHSAKQAAQSAIDAAMMAAARKEGVDEHGVEAAIDAYLSLSDAVKHGAITLSKAGRVTENNTTIEGEVVMRVPTRLLAVMGYSHVDVKVESRVVRGLGNVEIALVLDTTASMNGSRLTSVKSAATQLVDTLYGLQDAANKAKVSLVPFAQYVNVGQENRFATWMDVPPDTLTTATSCYDT